MDKVLQLSKILVLAALFFLLMVLGVFFLQAKTAVKHVDELAVVGTQLVQVVRDRALQLDATLKKTDAVLESANVAIKSTDTTLKSADAVVRAAKISVDNVNSLLVGTGTDDRSVRGFLANANGVTVQLGLAADVWNQASQEQKEYWAKNSEEFRKTLEAATAALVSARETVDGFKPAIANINATTQNMAEGTGTVVVTLKRVDTRVEQILKPGNFIVNILKTLLGMGGSAAQIVK